MPAGHSPAEVQLARALARELEIGELHVFWSAATVRPRAHGAQIPAVIRALAALGDVIGRLAASVEPRPRRD